MAKPTRHVLASRNRCLQKIGKMSPTVRAVLYGKAKFPFDTLQDETTNQPLLDESTNDYLLDE